MTGEEIVEPGTARRLEIIARTAQSEGRVPGLVAAVARKGDIVWSSGVGRARIADDIPLDVHTPYIVASNTKGFVAACVMALRDEGKVRLDAPLSDYLPVTEHGDVTIRSLLAHVSGLQREVAGSNWDSLVFPDHDGLVTSVAQARAVGTPHTYWHYSNLGYSLLGELVARLDGGDWFASVQRRILDPLGMTETWNHLPPADRPRAGTYFVPPWSDVPLEEPVVEPGDTGAAFSMVSTVSDMAKWGAFLADPVEEVLAADTVEEMCTPVAISDRRSFQSGYGLGLMVIRRGERMWVGHTGGMPGSITGIFTHRGSGTTGLAFMNASHSPAPSRLAIDLGDTFLDLQPELPEIWVPGDTVPTELESVLGHWFSEGHPWTFSVRKGELRAHADGDPADVISRFEHVDGDTYRTVEGAERGELLELTRDSDGQVVRMHWATYPFTRQPLPFGQG